MHMHTNGHKLYFILFVFNYFVWVCGGVCVCMHLREREIEKNKALSKYLFTLKITAKLLTY